MLTWAAPRTTRRRQAQDAVSATRRPRAPSEGRSRLIMVESVLTSWCFGRKVVQTSRADRPRNRSRRAEPSSRAGSAQLGAEAASRSAAGAPSSSSTRMSTQACDGSLSGVRRWSAAATGTRPPAPRRRRSPRAAPGSARVEGARDVQEPDRLREQDFVKTPVRAEVLAEQALGRASAPPCGVNAPRGDGRGGRRRLRRPRRGTPPRVRVRTVHVVPARHVADRACGRGRRGARSATRARAARRRASRWRAAPGTERLTNTCGTQWRSSAPSSRLAGPRGG